jgi:hypothetical protein
MEATKITCEECKKDITKLFTPKYEHKCAYCHKAYCRPCDDRTTHLKWYGKAGELDGVDVYACERCVKRQNKKGDSLAV